MIQDGAKSPEERVRQEEDVRAVVQYCQNVVDCRRVQVLRYFGQSFSPEFCHKSCNNCVEMADTVEEDMADAAANAIGLVQDLLLSNPHITKSQCITVFRGGLVKEVKDRGYQHQRLFGVGAHMKREKVERLFDHLIALRAFDLETHQNQQGWNSLYITVSSIHPSEEAQRLFDDLVGSQVFFLSSKNRTINNEVQDKRRQIKAHAILTLCFNSLFDLELPVIYYLILIHTHVHAHLTIQWESQKNQ